MKIGASVWLWIGFGIINLACGKTRVEAPYVCQPMGLGSRKQFSVGWQASKGEGKIVTGQISGDGVFVPGAKMLADGTVSMNFDVWSLESGVELRNERLRNYFFKAVSFPVITFKGKVIEVDDASMPDPGESREMTIAGELMIAGQMVKMNVYATLANEDGNIRLKHSTDKKTMINIMATDGLRLNVQDMLHAANVDSMEPDVLLFGHYSLVETCK